MSLGSEDIILGLPWLYQVNAEVDWQKGLIMIRPETNHAKQETMVEVVPDVDNKPVTSTLVLESSG